jgi:hypothetical protein
MSAFRIAFDVALLALVAFIIYRVVIRYRSATGTVWQRLLATAWGSATFLAGFATTIGSTLMIYSDQILELLNLQQVQDIIHKLPPSAIGYFGLAVTALMVLGRLRGVLAPLLYRSE